MAKILWCQNDLGPIGKRQLCLKPTRDGLRCCPSCGKLFPIWPTNDDGSACTPHIIKEVA